MDILQEALRRISELERRLSNVVTIGRVTQVDENNARVKVKIGDIETTWLKWGEEKAGADRSWSCPDKNEQVVVVSPSGDLAQGIVSRRLYQLASPPPARSKDVTRTEFSDGMVMEHDRFKKITRISAFDSEGTLVLEAKNLVLRTGEGGYYQIDNHGKATRLSHEEGNLFTLESWNDVTVVNSIPDHGFAAGKVISPKET